MEHVTHRELNTEVHEGIHICRFEDVRIRRSLNDPTVGVLFPVCWSKVNQDENNSSSSSNFYIQQQVKRRKPARYSQLCQCMTVCVCACVCACVCVCALCKTREWCVKLSHFM